MKHEEEKAAFAAQLKAFACTLGDLVSKDDEWTIRGFIDIFKNVYTISTDTKVLSKILELHLFPYFLSFAEDIKYDLVLATYQKWYPDLTFVSRKNPEIKFAVDLKTTYRDQEFPDYCNGFTLGSHGEYFINRTSTKNIQYPYCEYSGHFCLGVIYTRNTIDKDIETKIYSVEEVEAIPAVINHFIFFAEEKWKIASDKGGSGNTANIGSVKRINDLLNGNGVFANANEELFDDYWMNYGRIMVPVNGKRVKLSSFPAYLQYRRLPAELYNPMPARKK